MIGSTFTRIFSYAFFFASHTLSTHSSNDIHFICVNSAGSPSNPSKFTNSIGSTDVLHRNTANSNRCPANPFFSNQPPALYAYASSFSKTVTNST